MDKNSINMGRQFKIAREYRGYTKTEIAKNVNGVSQSNLSKFEKGFRVLSEEKIRAMMKFVDFPYDFLFKTCSVNIVFSKKFN